MIASDHDRRLHYAAADQIVYRQPEARALAVAEPEDTGGQPLERDALVREPDPAAERRVPREHLEREAVGGGDVGGIARERGPPERPLEIGRATSELQSLRH